MAAVTPEEFYKDNIDKEKEYVCVYVAHEIKAGEEVDLGANRFTAKEDGYTIDYQFMTKAEFAEKTTPAENLELPLPRKEPSEEDLQRIKPVKKGEKVMMDFNFFSMIINMDHDGFIITEKDGQSYVPNFELTSVFNWTGRKFETEKVMLVTLNDGPPFKGIILDKETTFAFKNGKETAPAGYNIARRAESEDGYALHYADILKGPADILKGPNALNTVLRVSAAWTGHSVAIQKQAKLKARAPRVRLK